MSFHERYAGTRKTNTSRSPSSIGERGIGHVSSDAEVEDLRTWSIQVLIPPDTKWQNMDSTPAVFMAGIIKGWGKYYYEQRPGSPRFAKDP